MVTTRGIIFFRDIVKNPKYCLKQLSVNQTLLVLTIYMEILNFCEISEIFMVINFTNEIGVLGVWVCFYLLKTCCFICVVNMNKHLLNLNLKNNRNIFMNRETFNDNNYKKWRSQ